MDNAKDLDVVMPEKQLIVQKRSGSLWQYHKDNPNDSVTNFKQEQQEEPLLLVLPKTLK